MGTLQRPMSRAPTRTVPPSRRAWPLGMRLLYWVAAAGLVAGLLQSAYWAFSGERLFDRPVVQAVYATVGLLLIAACVIAGTAADRRAFGLWGLATAAFHLCVTCWFNFEMAVAADASPLAPLRVWDRWDANTGYFCWNWMVIAIDASICYYLLRYEIRYWRRPDASEPAGFDVAPPE